MSRYRDADHVMSIDAQQSIDDHTPVNRARIGLRWGALFWLPILLLVLGLGASFEPAPRKPYLIACLAIFAILMLLAFLLAGRRWAMRGLGGEWSFLLTAIAQGFFAVLLSLTLPSTLMRIWLSSAHSVAAWGFPDQGFPMFVWGFCSVWMLALGAVIEWRVRRASSLALKPFASTSSEGAPAIRSYETTAPKPDDAADDASRSVQETRLRRSAVTLIACIGVPLLLCAPVVLMLRYDIGLRKSANAILHGEINAVAPQIADLKDFESVKSRMLARQQIIRHLETTAPANVLAIFGHLPSGVQLLWLEMKDDHLALALRAESSAEPALLELLAQNGYPDPQIAARQEDDDHTVEHVTIEADRTREEVERK